MFDDRRIGTEQVRTGTPSRPRFRLWSRLTTLLSLICVAALLAACGATSDDNEEDRRFANDPSENTGATRTPPPENTAVPAATPAGESLPSPETLLRARGAPATVYAILNGAIQVIDVGDGGSASRSIPPPEGGRFLAIDSSPSGDRVAAVTASSGATPRLDLLVFASTGDVLESWNGILPPDEAGATPVAGRDTGPGDVDVMVDWGSQGNRIAVASPAGRLASVTIGGEVGPVSTPAGVVAIYDIEWSPRGDRLALLADAGDGIARIGLTDPAVASPEFLAVAPLDDGAEPDRIHSFAWLPDGSGLVYLAGAGAGAEGGQLLSLDLETMTERLVATPGRGGPSATINDFSLSPDGKAVAYTIVLPDGGAWRFNSLWVRSLRDQRALAMPVGDVSEVNAIWWVGRGIVWGQAVRQSDGIQETFVRLEPQGEPVAILDVRIGGREAAGGTPAATPALATPAAQVDRTRLRPVPVSGG